MPYKSLSPIFRLASTPALRFVPIVAIEQAPPASARGAAQRLQHSRTVRPGWQRVGGSHTNQISS
jgi:hypothetical protein